VTADLPNTNIGMILHVTSPEELQTTRNG